MGEQSDQGSGTPSVVSDRGQPVIYTDGGGTPITIQNPVEVSNGEDISPSSVTTDELNNAFFASKTLAQDGSTDDATNLTNLIQDNEGSTIILTDEGVVNIDTDIAPNISDRTVIECWGNPTIDVSGVSANPILDFSSADNLTIRGPLTISGDSGAGLGYSLQTGPGFRFSDLTFSGGQGALMTGADDCFGIGLDASDQRDTDKGEVAGLDVRNANVAIYDIDISNSDRGVEVEDGAEDVLLERGRLDTIDNTQASNPQAVFVLDAHTHSGGTAIENTTYRDWTVVDCDTDGDALDVQQDGPSIEVSFENIKIVDSGHIHIYGDEVTIDDLDYHSPNVTPPNSRVIEWEGGNLTLRDVETHDAENYYLVPSSAAISFGELHVENAVVAGDTWSAAAPFGNANIDAIRWNGLRVKGDFNLAVFEFDHDNILDTDGRGAVFIDCDCTVDGGENGWDVNETNAPITIIGGHAAAMGNLPDGSVIHGLDGITLADVGDGIVVNGAIKESANSETPSGSEPNLGHIVEFTDSGDGTGDGAYFVESGGTVQGPI